MSRWFWLSFADPHKPEGEQFLGVAIVPVDEQVTELIDTLDHTDRIDLLKSRSQEEDVPFYVAVQYASLLGLNPGGEVQGFEISTHIELVNPACRGKLLTREQLLNAGLIGEQ